jgi:exodeoxyribonuclease-3
MRIATWNINGVKARLNGLLAWLKEAGPDVVCLQEIKTVDEGFPHEAIADLGYAIAVHGQKGFNGVAVLSRAGLEEATPGLPGGASDDQARYLEAVIPAGKGIVRVASLYLPNGNPVGTEKFAYKLAWMRRLEAHMRTRLALEDKVVFAGDYNVIPEAVDAKNPAAWADDALFQPESRQMWRRYLALGMVDALRACHPEPGVYTFWDYQAGAFQKDHGIRIDHLLLSPQAADKLRAAGVDRHVRAWEKPSDHVPVWVELGMG